MRTKYLHLMLLWVFTASVTAQTAEEFLKTLPEPFVGVKIVPAQEMSSLSTNEMRNKQFKEIGYIKSDTENPKKLMEIKNRVPQGVMANAADPFNYYLRKNVSDIQLSFHYQPISREKLLGFAPVGTHISTGWTGVREFFEDKNFGICSLTKYHIINSKMGIRINADAVSYSVDSNPTTVEVEGSDNSGFIYTVSWVDSLFSNHLECAKSTFDKNMINQMTSFANQIAHVR